MKIKLILLFILFYLLSLLITVPANTVMRFIPEDAGISVAAASGTVWQGKALNLNYRNRYQLQQVDWKVDWLALTHLQVKLDIKFNNGSNGIAGKGFLLFGPSGFSIEDLIVDMQAAELLTYSAFPLPVEVSGDFSLVVKKASQGAPYCQELTGQLVWQNGKINSSIGNVDLASPTFDLSCKNGQLNVDLQQQSEQLSSEFNLLLKKGGSYQLQGAIKATEQLSPSLKQALTMLGSENQSGVTIVNYNGRL